MTVADTSSAEKRAEHTESTRDDLLLAALKAFAAHGFDGATVRGIAASAGMTHGMVRYHYESKEKLWFAAVAHLFEKHDAAVRLSPEEVERLRLGDNSVMRSMLRRYVRYCAEYPEHARILTQESVSLSPRMRIALTRHLKDHLQAVRSTVCHLQKIGTLPASAPPESVMYMITGACQNIFTLAPEAEVTLGYDPLSEEAIEAHADLIIDMFLPVDRG